MARPRLGRQCWIAEIDPGGIAGEFFKVIHELVKAGRRAMRAIASLDFGLAKPGKDEHAG
jgi:hypothetical protein